MASEISISRCSQRPSGPLALDVSEAIVLKPTAGGHLGRRALDLSSGTFQFACSPSALASRGGVPKGAEMIQFISRPPPASGRRSIPSGA